MAVTDDGGMIGSDSSETCIRSREEEERDKNSPDIQQQTRNARKQTQPFTLDRMGWVEMEGGPARFHVS